MRTTPPGFLLLLLAAWLPPAVRAFGTPGHRIVANLAWRLLSPQTADAVQEILDNGSNWYYDLQMVTRCYDCTPLGAVAEWADDIKSWRQDLPSHSVSLHPVNVANCPDAASDCYLDYERDCGEGCIIQAITRYSVDLLPNDLQAEVQTEATDIARPWWWSVARFLGATSSRESLMFLAHLLGDLHQPLHSGLAADRLGVSIEVSFLDYFYEDHIMPFVCALPFDFITSLFGCSLNLHSFWDNTIVTEAMTSDFGGSRDSFEESIWQDFLVDNDETISEWLSCFSDEEDGVVGADGDSPVLSENGVRDCAVQWSEESVELAWRYAYEDVDGTKIAEGTDLSEEYYQRALPVVREQFAKGAVRFAAILERALG